MTEYDWNDRHRRQTLPVTVGTVNGHSNGHAGGYGAAALQGEIRNLLGTTEGGRNNQLNISALKLGGLVASGHLNETEVVDSLIRTAAQIGLEAREIRGTVRSGMNAGLKNPRQVPPNPNPVEIIDPTTLVAPPEGTGGPVGDEEAERVRTTWWPLPIAQRAVQAAEQPAPTHLVRDDDQALFYTGKVNGLIGESESGKSWIALLAVTQAAAEGQRILLLDFEDSPASVHRRLNSLGVTTQQLDHIHYADPTESLGLAQSADLQEALASQYQMIVADGINAAMTLLGYDLISNTDATMFAAKLLRPLARTGACVITVDHVPKNPDARGKGGIGAQAKRSMMDGTCLLVEVVEPFGKGQSGTLRLTVDKDRNGAVRGICSEGRYAGKAHLESTADRVRLHIAAPDLRPTDKRPAWKPTYVMEKVSRFLENLGGTSSYRAIEEAVGGRKDIVRRAVTALVDGGHVTLTSGPNRSIQHHLHRPFREDEAPVSPVSPVSPGVPQVSPGDTSAGVPNPRPPYGAGDTQRHPNGTPVSPIEKQPGLDMPDNQSSCNHCGQATPDNTLDDTAGYCLDCARLWGGRP